MSTPSYAPQPPAYDPRPRRSIAGPVVLVLMGVLLLLANLRFIGWSRLGHYFVQYWPALLILWGLIKLVEYFIARQQNRPVRPIGVGGVFLVILLMLGGLIANRVENSRVIQNIDLDNEDLGWVLGQQYTFEQQIEQPYPSGTSLQVVCGRGSVAINAWDQNTIKVSITKRLRAQTQGRANEIDQASRAQLTSTGNQFHLDASSHGNDAQIESNLQIYIPVNAAVNVVANRGDVTVRNRTGGVYIVSSRGSITLDDIRGDARLSVRRGDITANKISGDVIVNGAADQVNISEVGGNVRLDEGVGDTMRLSRISNESSYRSSRTRLQVAKVDGNLVLESGDLHGDQITGLRLITSSKDIRLDRVSGPIHVENTNGILEINAAQPLGPMQLSNRRSAVRLTLPPQAAFQLDVRAHRGDIKSDFPLRLQRQNENNVSTDSFGSGGPKVNISNWYGDVEIEKAMTTSR